MNPGTSETSGLNLPPPVGEALPPVPSKPETSGGTPELRPAASEINRSGTAAPPIIPLPLPSDAAIPTVQAPTGKGSTSAIVTPVKAADDGDLIEKEWVNKAKAIVERTRDDPHKQSQELTGVKVDYMKQRYDKTLKTKP